MKQCKGTPYDGTGHKVNSDAFAIRNLFYFFFFKKGHARYFYTVTNTHLLMIMPYKNAHAHTQS